MNIEEIKKEMIDYKDMFGQNLLEVEMVDSSKTKLELSSIIDNHMEHLDNMCNDA